VLHGPIPLTDSLICRTCGKDLIPLTAPAPTPQSEGEQNDWAQLKCRRCGQRYRWRTADPDVRPVVIGWRISAANMARLDAERTSGVQDPSRSR
jgi:ribosomal protein L37E